VVSFGLVASPRRDGNTAAAVADVLAGAASAGAEIDSAWLETESVTAIGDCAACIARGACTINDGFDALMERVIVSDMLVLGTPLYWYGPSAQLKAFLDRWSCRLDRDERAFRTAMRDKRVVLVVAQGERGFYEAAACLQILEWTVRYLEMVLCARIVVVGHARGDYGADVAQRPRVVAAGAQAAKGLAADVSPPWFHLRHRPGEPLGGIYPAD
jgi:multimeric flavodoxin WrbA